MGFCRVKAEVPQLVTHKYPWNKDWMLWDTSRQNARHPHAVPEAAAVAFCRQAAVILQKEGGLEPCESCVITTACTSHLAFFLSDFISKMLLQCTQLSFPVQQCLAACLLFLEMSCSIFYFLYQIIMTLHLLEKGKRCSVYRGWVFWFQTML